MSNEKAIQFDFRFLEKVFDQISEWNSKADKETKSLPDPSNTDQTFSSEEENNYSELREWMISAHGQLKCCEGIREEKGSYKRYDSAFIHVIKNKRLFSASNRTVSQLLSTAKNNKDEYLPTSLLAKRYPREDQCALVSWLVISYLQENGYSYIISSENKAYELTNTERYFTKIYQKICRAKEQSSAAIRFTAARELLLTDSESNFAEYFWKGYKVQFLSDENELLRLILKNWRIYMDGRQIRQTEDCTEAERSRLIGYFCDETGSGKSSRLRQKLVEEFMDYPLGIILLNRERPQYARTQQLLREIVTIYFNGAEEPGLELAPPTDAIRAKLAEPFVQGAPVRSYTMSRYYRVLGNVAGLARNKENHSFSLEECGLIGDREMILRDAIKDGLIVEIPNGRYKMAAKEYRLAILALDAANMLNRCFYTAMDREIAWRSDAEGKKKKSPLDGFFHRFTSILRTLVLNEADAIPREKDPYVGQEECLRIEILKEGPEKDDAADASKTENELQEKREKKKKKNALAEQELSCGSRAIKIKCEPIRRPDLKFHAERRFSSQAFGGSMLLSYLDSALRKLALKELIRIANNYKIDVRLEQMCALSVLTFFLCENIGRLTPELREELYIACYSRTLYEPQARLLPHIRTQHPFFDSFAKKRFKKACVLEEPHNDFLSWRKDRRIASGVPIFNFLQGEEGLYTEEELQNESEGFRRLILACQAQAKTWFLGDRTRELPTLDELLKIIWDGVVVLKKNPGCDDSLNNVYALNMSFYALANASYRKRGAKLAKDFLEYLDTADHAERILEALLLADYWNRRRAVVYGLEGLWKSSEVSKAPKGGDTDTENKTAKGKQEPKNPVDPDDYYILEGPIRVVCEYRLWDLKQRYSLEELKLSGVDPETCREDYHRFARFEKDNRRNRHFLLLLRFMGIYGIDCERYLNSEEVRAMYPEEERPTAAASREESIEKAYQNAYESGYEGEYGDEETEKDRTAPGKNKTGMKEEKEAEKKAEARPRIFLPYDQCPGSFELFCRQVRGAQ